MQEVQEIIESTAHYLHNLSLRERILVLVVACGLILFIGDALLLSRYDNDVKRMENEHHSLITERQGIEAQIADLTAELVAAKATHQQAKDAVAETELTLKQKTAQIEDKLNRLVPPPHK